MGRSCITLARHHLAHPHPNPTPIPNPNPKLVTSGTSACQYVGITSTNAAGLQGGKPVGFGDGSLLEDGATNLATMHYVRQRDPLGLGHAVLRAHMHVGQEPFAVLLGDDLIDERDVLLERMIAVHDSHAANVVALMEVEPSQTHLYGIATVEATEESDVVRVTGLVEKPRPEDAPSNLAVIGRYVLQPEVFHGMFYA